MQKEEKKSNEVRGCQMYGMEWREWSWWWWFERRKPVSREEEQQQQHQSSPVTD